MKNIIVFALIMIVITLSACGVEQSISNSSADDAGNVSAEETIQSGGGPLDSSEEQSEAPVAENSTKIQSVVSKNCNFVYHMLAVSNCGYVNDYGSTYKHLHADTDLQTLKNNEQHLTVSGGEHQGDLYFLCVALPASLDDEIPVSEYFEALADLFGTGEIERNFETYRDIYEQSFSSVAEVSLNSFREFYSANEALKKEIAEITAVMKDNYGIYSEEVWEKSLAELSVVAAELNKEFANADYESKWEELLDYKYGQDAFLALMCNSMDNGPNAINISEEKDVFYHLGEYTSTAKFISHEFGIYLLMDVLADTEAFQVYSYYGLTEGLAEYYNMVVSGGLTDWNAGAEYIDFYTQLRDDDPEITAKEMFLRAVDFYKPVSD